MNSVPSAEPSPDDASQYPMPASQPMLMTGVRAGAWVTFVAIVVFALIGYFVNGARGLTGGIIGAAIGGILLLLTVGSIAFANRFVRSPMYLQIFFGIVLGSWVLKLVGFVVAALLLKNQPWLDPQLLFIALVVTVIASIAMDVVIVARARVPYVQTP